MEDDLTFRQNGRRPHFLIKMEENFNFKWLAPASAELGTAQPQLVKVNFWQARFLWAIQKTQGKELQ